MGPAGQHDADDLAEASERLLDTIAEHLVGDRIADHGQIAAEAQRLHQVSLGILERWLDGDGARRDAQPGAAIGVVEGSVEKLCDQVGVQWTLASLLVKRRPAVLASAGFGGQNIGSRGVYN